MHTNSEANSYTIINTNNISKNLPAGCFCSKEVKLITQLPNIITDYSCFFFVCVNYQDILRVLCCSFLLTSWISEVALKASRGKLPLLATAERWVWGYWATEGLRVWGEISPCARLLDVNWTWLETAQIPCWLHPGLHHVNSTSFLSLPYIMHDTDATCTVKGKYTQFNRYIMIIVIS